MTEQKFNKIFSTMTTQAVKVWDSIPISDAWTTAQVMSDMHRRGVSMRDLHVISGCLNHMVSSGIVIEKPKGYFRRDVIRTKVVKENPLNTYTVPETNFEETPIQEEQEEPMSPKTTVAVQKTIEKAASTPVTPTPINPVDVLMTFAGKLQSLAKQHEVLAKQHELIAKEFEALVFEISEQLEKDAAAAAKVRQFQQLWASMNAPS